MSKFTSGLIAGSLIGVASITWALSDNRTRRRMAKDTRRMMNRANDVLGNMSNMF